MLKEQLIVGKRYNITLSDTIDELDVSYYDLSYSGEVSAMVAKSWLDIATVHEQFKSRNDQLLDYDQYNYYLFEFNGRLLPLADCWIDWEYSEPSSDEVISIKITSIDGSKLTLVENYLKSLGLSYTIER